MTRLVRFFPNMMTTLMHTLTFFMITLLVGCASTPPTQEETKKEETELLERCQQLQQDIEDLKGRPVRRSAAREYYASECTRGSEPFQNWLTCQYSSILTDKKPISSTRRAFIFKLELNYETLFLYNFFWKRLSCQLKCYFFLAGNNGNFIVTWPVHAH